jgi:hypothetical protein
MYIRKRVICEWCQWNYENLSSWTNFTASRSWRKSFFTTVCRYRGCSHLSHAECVNVYSFTVFLGEPDFYWFDWLKPATDFESLVSCRKGMDFYRASNSPSWGAAVEGAVCRGWVQQVEINSVLTCDKILVLFHCFEESRSVICWTWILKHIWRSISNIFLPTP